MAVAGSDDPPPASPDWWRERRARVGAAVLVVLVLTMGVLARTLPRASEDTATPNGTPAASQSNGPVGAKGSDASGKAPGGG